MARPGVARGAARRGRRARRAGKPEAGSRGHPRGSGFHKATEPAYPFSQRGDTHRGCRRTQGQERAPKDHPHRFLKSDHL